MELEWFSPEEELESLREVVSGWSDQLQRHAPLSINWLETLLCSFADTECVPDMVGGRVVFDAMGKAFDRVWQNRSDRV